MKDWTDTELLERVLRRDPGGWPEFHRRFGKLIRYWLNKKGRSLDDDARDEIFQNVIVAFLRDDMKVLRNYDVSRAKLSYFVTLHTRWEIGKYRRQLRRDDRIQVAAEDDIASLDVPAAGADGAFLERVFDRAASEYLGKVFKELNVSALDGELFDLHYKQGRSLAECATALGVSWQAVDQRKHKLETRLIAAARRAEASIGTPREVAARLRAVRSTRPETRADAEKSSPWQPREYELRAVNEIWSRLRIHRRVLAVGPTGCGKTVIASMLLAAHQETRALFVVHRYELADQAYRALNASGIRVGVLMAQDEELHGAERVDSGARVQVASVQTLARRTDAGPLAFDLVVFDEAHRVMAESYQAIARRFAKAMVLGLTATPMRADGKGLGDFFANMYTIAQPSALQQAKHLALPRWFGARADVVARLTERLKGARTANGDYAPRDLARAVDSRFLIGEVVAESLRIAPGVSKVVFAGSVQHSRQIAARFTNAGIAAAHLDGDTPPTERAAMLSALSAGRLEVICNYDVLAEGWDLPDLGAVVLARPFRSLARYLQAVGRGMRWRRGPRPIVIDHGNNAPRFGLWPGDDIEWSLEGTRKAGAGLWKLCAGCLQRIPIAATTCPECGLECPIDRTRKEREEAEAKLEEATRAEYLALRSRVEAMAKKKGAPAGWAESVLGDSA